MHPASSQVSVRASRRHHVTSLIGLSDYAVITLCSWHGTAHRPTQAPDRADELVDGREALDIHESRDVHRADLTDPAQIVPEQVNDHQILGTILQIHRRSESGKLLQSGDTSQALHTNGIAPRNGRSHLTDLLGCC